MMVLHTFLLKLSLKNAGVLAQLLNVGTNAGKN